MDTSYNIPTFLSNFLTRPATAIPKGAQWLIGFENLNSLLDVIDKAYEYEPQSKFWNTRSSAEIIIKPEFLEQRGCFFAQAIQLPGEKIQTNTEGNIVSNALLRARVGAGRTDFDALKITFLETNVSFADAFLRGWSLATANFGLIARKPDDPLQYRTTLHCYRLGTYSVDEEPAILQRMRFEGVCCVSVSDEEYNYAPLNGTATMREAEFVFNSYSIDSSSSLPVSFKYNEIPSFSEVNPETLERLAASS